MYYIKKLPCIDRLVHIHVKNRGKIILKSCDNLLRETTMTTPQAERLFNAHFRWVTNDDKTKTKVFL